MCVDDTEKGKIKHMAKIEMLYILVNYLIIHLVLCSIQNKRGYREDSR